MKFKVVTLLSICLAAFFSSNAQLRLDPFFPFAQCTIGVGGGYSQLYGNLDHSNSGSVVRVNVDRNSNAWVSLGLQLQHGNLSDYEAKNNWTNGLSSNNSFNSLDLNGKISIGEFFNAPRNYFLKAVFGIYVGAGVGYMINDISNVTTKFRRTDNLLITDYNSDYIKKNTSNFFIPMNLGINLHLTRRCMFNVNYNFSYAMSDYLDGYNFQQPIANNKYNSMFSVLSFGLNFYVGKIGNGRRLNNRYRHN